MQGADGLNVVINDTTLTGKSAIYSTFDSLGGFSRIILDANGNQTSPNTAAFGYGAEVTCDHSDCASAVAGSYFYSPSRPQQGHPDTDGDGGQFSLCHTRQLVGSASADGKHGRSPPDERRLDGLELDRNRTGIRDKDNPNVLLAGVAPNGQATQPGGPPGQLWLTTNASSSSTPFAALPAFTALNAYSPTSVVFDQRSSQWFYVADGSQLFGTNNQGANFQNLTAKLPVSFIRPTALEFINSNGVNALLVGGLNNVDKAQSPITVADSDGNGNLSGWRPFGQGLPNSQISALSYNPLVDVLAVGTFGRGVAALYDVTSYFKEATVLQFGLADNNSQPDASYLTDGTNLDGTTFVRPLNKYGTGTLTIAGAASYTGGTTIYGGTTMLGNGGAGGSITGNVAFCNDAANPLCDTSINKALAFNRSDSYAFDGTISGPGQVFQIGSGTTILTGASTYTGPTFVDSGTLAVNGSITSLVTVNSGGTLAGIGSVGSTTIAPGGVLEPGYNGAGTLHISGDLQFSAGSLYLPGTATSTTVSGTATLAGTIAPQFMPSANVSKSSILLAAGNPLTTRFDTVAWMLPPSVSGSVGYTSNDVILNLTSQIATMPGLTPNETAVGGALDTAFNSNGGLPALGSLYALSPAGLAAALNQLSGQSLASEQKRADQRGAL